MDILIFDLKELSSDELLSVLTFPLIKDTVEFELKKYKNKVCNYKIIKSEFMCEPVIYKAQIRKTEKIECLNAPDDLLVNTILYMFVNTDYNIISSAHFTIEKTNKGLVYTRVE